MSRYRMIDGSIVDTMLASQHWDEAQAPSQSPKLHQRLYVSRKGRYYIEYTQPWSRNHVEWVSPEEAVRWLLAQGHPLPKDLAGLETEIME